jgi:hypothetical protein
MKRDGILHFTSLLGVALCQSPPLPRSSAAFTRSFFFALYSSVGATITNRIFGHNQRMEKSAEDIHLELNNLSSHITGLLAKAAAASGTNLNEDLTVSDWSP